MMQIRIGYEIGIATTQATPLICLVAPEIARHRDFIAPEAVMTTPHVPIHNYYDRYQNICRRMVAPAGTFTLRSDVTLNDDGNWDRFDTSAQEMPVETLPDEVLGFLTPSRYVESDIVAQEAWSLFGGMTPGFARVQGIVDYVHNLLNFDYGTASVFRTAVMARDGRIAVCRDFAHLALAYFRAMNIPARYVNGYIGDIGVPKSATPMDFAAWTEVFLSGRWHTFDPRNNVPRKGRIVVARGHDAADVPLLNSFGQHTLTNFQVWCYPVDRFGAEIDGMAFA